MDSEGREVCNFCQRGSEALAFLQAVCDAFEPLGDNPVVDRVRGDAQCLQQWYAVMQQHPQCTGEAGYLDLDDNRSGQRQLEKPGMPLVAATWLTKLIAHQPGRSRGQQ